MSQQSTMVERREGERMRKWIVMIAGGLLIAGIGVFLAVEGLDKADKWASVFGLFVALAGLGLTVGGGVDARRRPGGQSVTDSTIGGGVAQVRGVRGNVRIGPGPAPAVPTAPPPPSPAPSSTGGGEGDGQSVTRSSTAGPVRQVDDVGGDVELDS